MRCNNTILTKNLYIEMTLWYYPFIQINVCQNVRVMRTSRDVISHYICHNRHNPGHYSNELANTG